MTKTAFLMLGMIVVLLAAYWWVQRTNTAMDPVLKSIVDNYRGSSGKIEDPMNSLGIEGKESVGYSIIGTEMTVWYGKQQFRLRIPPSEESVTEYLNALGLSIRTAADNETRLLYQGEEVERYE